jgi:hypothetical protein
MCTHADHADSAVECPQEAPARARQRKLDLVGVLADRCHDLDLRRAELTLEARGAVEQGERFFVRVGKIECLGGDEHQLFLDAHSSRPGLFEDRCTGSCRQRRGGRPGWAGFEIERPSRWRRDPRCRDFEVEHG